jgi:hypothetical protein
MKINFQLPGPNFPIGSDQCPEGFTQVFLMTVVKIYCPESVIVEKPLKLSQESGFKSWLYCLKLFDIRHVVISLSQCSFLNYEMQGLELSA